MKYFVLVCIFLILSCNNATKEVEIVDVEDFKNYSVSAQELVKQHVDEASKLMIYIDKSEYKLSLKYQGKTLKEYPVVFGENPVDDKRMEGDMCTPEGRFQLRDLYPHKKWSKFMWINYPTAESEKKFKKSKKQGTIPEDATIGGEVGIHGVPEGKNKLIFEKNNWTWGCISMTNQDVDDLYKVAFKGMQVEIVP